MQTVKKGQITLKMKKILSALLASAVAMSLVAGCGGEKKEDAKASDVIKVGVFLPLTGDNAAGGELELHLSFQVQLNISSNPAGVEYDR